MEWEEYLKAIKLSPAKAMKGGQFTGQDLKTIIDPENLKKMAPSVPRAITEYMAAIDQLHTMAVDKSLAPYNVSEICQRFRDTFTQVYTLGIGISATTKIHICWTHIEEYFMLTGMESLYTADCSSQESAHGAVRKLEERSNLEVRQNRGGECERKKLETTVALFNYHNNVILPEVGEEFTEEAPAQPRSEVVSSLSSLANSLTTVRTSPELRNQSKIMSEATSDQATVTVFPDLETMVASSDIMIPEVKEQSSRSECCDHVDTDMETRSLTEDSNLREVFRHSISRCESSDTSDVTGLSSLACSPTAVDLKVVFFVFLNFF